MDITNGQQRHNCDFQIDLIQNRLEHLRTEAAYLIAIKRRFIWISKEWHDLCWKRMHNLLIYMQCSRLD